MTKLSIFTLIQKSQGCHHYLYFKVKENAARQVKLFALNSHGWLETELG